MTKVLSDLLTEKSRRMEGQERSYLIACANEDSIWSSYDLLVVVPVTRSVPTGPVAIGRDRRSYRYRSGIGRQLLRPSVATHRRI
jgi:hypothetical protein